MYTGARKQTQADASESSGEAERVRVLDEKWISFQVPIIFLERSHVSP